jgi:hypothetical protein
LDLPDDLRYDLGELHNHVKIVAESVGKLKGENATDKNDADALIGWRNINWNFKNKHVDIYRKNASARTPAQWRQWHQPHYFSATPLPASESIMCKVIFPAAMVGATKHTVLKFGSKETATQMIQQACLKFHISTTDAPTYVFKANGLFDFMAGDVPLLSFEVRRCNEIHLLVHTV